MKKCCNFWHEQKHIYKKEICQNIEEEKITEFVIRMRNICVCPECGHSFDKLKICKECYGLNDLNSNNCQRCGKIILEN